MCATSRKGKWKTMGGNGGDERERERKREGKIGRKGGDGWRAREID